MLGTLLGCGPTLHACHLHPIDVLVTCSESVYSRCIAHVGLPTCDDESHPLLSLVYLLPMQMAVQQAIEASHDI